MAEAGPLSDLQQAQADLVRAQLAFVTNRGSDAPPLLLKAAVRLEPIDAELSRATYLDALSAAIFAGRLASPGGGVLEVARAVGAAPPPSSPRGPPTCSSTAWPRTTTRGTRRDCRCCARRWPRSATACRPTRNCAGCGWPAWPRCGSGTTIAGTTLSARYLQLAREVGALSELPLALISRAYLLLFAGELTAAADADRRGAGGQGGDREQPRAVRRAGPGRVPRRRGRRPCPDRSRPWRR